jgi:aminoglycoside 6'-N-acetyltransferase
MTAATKVLHGQVVTLRPPTDDDVAALVAIRAHPDVWSRWGGGDDPSAAVLAELVDDGAVGFVMEVDGRVAGWISWYEQADPDYRHAGMDLYVDPTLRGRGVGPDAVRTLARHLLTDHGHHRLVIDPAADNLAAIRAYEKVGFKPVGIMRAYERGTDGTFHDGLLMDLLADDLTAD